MSRLASLIRRISISALFLVIMPWCIVIAMCIRVSMLPEIVPCDGRDVVEMQAIVAALNAHAAKFGSYPPDFSTDDPAKEIREHLKNKFPLREHTLDLPKNIASLNPRNALHFWLTGCFFNDPYFPITGKNLANLVPMTFEEMTVEIESLDSIRIMREKGVPNVELTPEYLSVVDDYTEMIADQQKEYQLASLIEPLHFFDRRRLARNGEYSTRSSAAPLVYFRSDRYNDAFAEETKEWDGIAPYQSPDSTHDHRRYMSPTSFQVINAGRDGLYGLTAIRAVDAYQYDAHCDNLTSFLSVPLGQEQRLKQRKSAIVQRNVTPLMAMFCTLLYPIVIGLRTPEDGIVVLSRSIQSQWSPPSPLWKRILTRQRSRRRNSAINRMKVAHAERNSDARSNPNRHPATTTGMSPIQRSPDRP